MGVADLLQVTGRLNAPRMFEQSVKLSAGTVHADRGLISMDKRVLYPGPLTTLSQVCADLGISQITPLASHLKAAQAVHFGSDGGIAKCYLEFGPDDPPEEGLVFLALKANADNARLSRYVAMPQREALGWVASRLSGDLAAVANAAISMAEDHDPDGEAVVLHVKEDGTDRASVDISVADAAVSLADCEGMLDGLFSHFAVKHGGFLAEHGPRQFGHLALGCDQQGRDFATIYFGARPI